MRFHAVGKARDGRALESYSAQESTILKWARMIAEQHGCEVKIYIREERLIQTVEPDVAKRVNTT